MDRLANMLTEKLYQNKCFSNEDKEIYCYGIKLILADIINFSIILVLGVILKQFLESVVFLFTLCSIRKYSGGFHAKTFWLCRLSMILTYFCVIGTTELLLNFNVSFLACILINTLCVIIIAILSPVKNKSKILSKDQINKNKIKAFISAFCLAVCSTILMRFNLEMSTIIFVTMIAIVVLMFLGIIIQKGEKNNV